MAPTTSLRGHKNARINSELQSWSIRRNCVGPQQEHEGMVSCSGTNIALQKVIDHWCKFNAWFFTPRKKGELMKNIKLQEKFKLKFLY